MRKASKKALLDTDFLYKAQVARNKRNEPLADLIVQFDGYDFFCHKKILDELSQHGFSPDPLPWLEKQIRLGGIKQYSDSEILEEIENLFGEGAPNVYSETITLGGSEKSANYPLEIFLCFLNPTK